MTEAIYLEVTEKTEAAKKARRQVSVSGMLKFLGVSRSGYLAWLHHVPSDTEKRREAVKAKIQDIYDDSKQNYGAPKITVELRKTGEVISERTVGTYMRQMGIRAQWSKPWTITTKDSDFSTELQNILDEQFNPDRPNAVWCSDITYIWTIDGFVYLTSIMDLFSRKIIAWTLSETLEVSCVIDTINKAKARRNIDQPLIIHSDRGSQYVAKEYKKATENDTADRQCSLAPPASLFLSLMLPRKGQPFPPERRNCGHTFQGVLQFRLPSAPQRYNTLDFPRESRVPRNRRFLWVLPVKGEHYPL